jgi:hypothetical protein
MIVPPASGPFLSIDSCGTPWDAARDPRGRTLVPTFFFFWNSCRRLASGRLQKLARTRSSMSLFVFRVQQVARTVFLSRNGLHSNCGKDSRKTPSRVRIRVMFDGKNAKRGACGGPLQRPSFSAICVVKYVNYGSL